MNLIASIAAQFNGGNFLMTVGVLAIGALVLGFLGRAIFGSGSALSVAVSSGIGILFIYVVTVVIIGVGGELAQFNWLLSPLPFVSIQEESLMVFSFANAQYPEICSQILSMVILAFLVNLLDGFLPKGKNLITWTIFRCGTVVLAMIAHLLVTGFFETMLPDVIVTYAPTILLWLLVVMLAVGALKIVVGALIATVNPIMGALYTFFFATFIGKQLSKAVLTTALLTGLVWAMNEIGITVISISAAALMAYIPFLVVLLVIWYVVKQLL